MTRINVGIPPRYLPGPQLIAEHREIKRVPNAVRRHNPDLSNLPPEFKLGTGHVRFFYNKLGYLFQRYSSLYVECVRRGYHVTSFHSAWDGFPLKVTWAPDKKAIDTVLARFRERGIDLL